MADEGPATPYPVSRCHGCAHHRDVKTPRSWFLLCQAPKLPKYPPQPVLDCPGFTPSS